ncbi:MAG: hypothetical protein COV32_02960 [Candidatus Yonathbacteria bacterium CG10_big_fil_rev_8_21_14_0_10_43_136]|uniref:Ig-like domain-containing protein n=2 Tax=Parcubacteria group TaxID=1794811 RepID=A0A2M7Q522_9BACT
MYLMRIIALSTLLSGIISTPIFAFAQTSTTTAEQPDSADVLRENARLENQRLIDNFLNENMMLIPTEKAIRSSSIHDYLEINTSPKSPSPNEIVKVSVESYLTDLNKATIRWSLNGKVIASGIGKKSFTFKNGPSGKTTRISISIVTNSGENITKELSWNPIGLTIIWEADTYTPPFYRGKALLTPQAIVKIVALPDDTGTRSALDAGNLVYVWEKDGTNISESSGYGKNSFSFVGPKPYGDAKIKVRASSVNDAVKSETRVDLTLSQPFILFYEKHPLLGVWYNRPFGGNATLDKKEISLRAEPYFFSNETGELQTLKYIWSVNGSSVQNYGRTITLRNDTGAKGASAVSLAMNGTKQTFQSAKRSILLNFIDAGSSSRPIF